MKTIISLVLVGASVLCGCSRKAGKSERIDAIGFFYTMPAEGIQSDPVVITIPPGVQVNHPIISYYSYHESGNNDQFTIEVDVSNSDNNRTYYLTPNDNNYLSDANLITPGTYTYNVFKANSTSSLSSVHTTKVSIGGFDHSHTEYYNHGLTSSTPTSSVVIVMDEQAVKDLNRGKDSTKNK